MILGIDAGNTNIVAALIDNGNVFRECRYETKKKEKAEYHKQYLKQLAGGYEIEISGVMISSVVPEINACLEKVCSELVEKAPVFVSAGLKTGLAIRYDAPEKLGADLISAAAGAVKKYGSPVIVIDIGTATTFSVVNEKKEYLGGMIAAGPKTSIKALASMASQLSETELAATDKAVGSNTAECLRIGALTAHAAMIDGMIDRVKKSLNLSDVQIIATGGMAGNIISLCNHKIICDDTLIFYGLHYLYELNCI